MQELSCAPPPCFLLCSVVGGSAGYKRWLCVHMWASNPVPDEEGTDGASRVLGGRFSPLEKNEFVYQMERSRLSISGVFQWEDNVIPIPDWQFFLT